MYGLFQRLKMQTLLSAALTLLLGIMLLIAPGMAVNTLFLVLGWVLIITGAASLITAICLRGKPVGQGELVLGLIQLASGLVVLLRPTFLMSVFGIVLGLVLVLHGARDVQSAREAKALGYEWKVSLAVGLVTLVMGALVMINPFSTAKLLMRAAGLCLILDGVGGLLMVAADRR